MKYWSRYSNFHTRKSIWKRSSVKWYPFCLFLPLPNAKGYVLIPDGWLVISLQWRHNEHDGVSNHQLHNCLLNLLFRRRSKKASKLRVTGLCEGNSPVTGEFPSQMASNAENVSIWWRHHVVCLLLTKIFNFGKYVHLTVCYSPEHQ